ncbi:hypothetical protein [Streptomonospora litoralis]|uniref:hypothetical protein n=1 Tax=Streptomonospora litoralis TaxID=2498135 RepID=UPI001036B0F6|nr:hypothetical protein [Streptomonospora litoralis]
MPLPSTPAPAPCEVAPRAALVRPYVLAVGPQRSRIAERAAVAAVRPYVLAVGPQRSRIAEPAAVAAVRPYRRVVEQPRRCHTGAPRTDRPELVGITDTRAVPGRPGTDSLDDVRSALGPPLRALIAQRPDLAFTPGTPSRPVGVR